MEILLLLAKLESKRAPPSIRDQFRVDQGYRGDELRRQYNLGRSSGAYSDARHR